MFLVFFVPTRRRRGFLFYFFFFLRGDCFGFLSYFLDEKGSFSLSLRTSSLFPLPSFNLPKKSSNVKKTRERVLFDFSCFSSKGSRLKICHSRRSCRFASSDKLIITSPFSIKHLEGRELMFFSVFFFCFDVVTIYSF